MKLISPVWQSLSEQGTLAPKMDPQISIHHFFDFSNFDKCHRKIVFGQSVFKREISAVGNLRAFPEIQERPRVHHRSGDLVRW
ncbi:MAG: hypothetical protein C4519_03770 [Desulfobacteraceae bacterium]|nr:MAG: hypothetical protein C4519_03770 [Desulfobacteraceae bacterium]